MTTTTPRTNALAKLDDNVPTAFIWRLTLLATLGGFLFGYDTSNIGAALQFIPYQLNAFGTGYLVAGASLGAAAGALLAGPLTDRFGRKKLLIADALIYAIGALLSAFTFHVSRPADRPHAHRHGDRRRLCYRHGLHRRVRAGQAPRLAGDAAAVDDHRRHPHLVRDRAGHLEDLAARVGRRLALVLRSRRSARDRRADPARRHARVAAVVDPQGQVRRRAGRVRRNSTSRSPPRTSSTPHTNSSRTTPRAERPPPRAGRPESAARSTSCASSSCSSRSPASMCRSTTGRR